MVSGDPHTEPLVHSEIKRRNWWRSLPAIRGTVFQLLMKYELRHLHQFLRGRNPLSPHWLWGSRLKPRGGFSPSFAAALQALLPVHRDIGGRPRQPPLKGLAQRELGGH